MAYIYMITNDINNKLYIGKTNFSIEKRFKEHLRDARKRTEEKRPLYAAIRKYGAEHFKITLIEECSAEDSATREEYWINYYDSYNDGYNATKGGDGKKYKDYSMIFEYWENNPTKTEKDIALDLSLDHKTVQIALKEYGVSKTEIQNRSCKNKRAVKRINPDGTENIYNSIKEACVALGKTRSMPGISEVCNHKRKLAYGCKWEWV